MSVHHSPMTFKAALPVGRRSLNVSASFIYGLRTDNKISYNQFIISQVTSSDLKQEAHCIRRFYTIQFLHINFPCMHYTHIEPAVALSTCQYVVRYCWKFFMNVILNNFGWYTMIKFSIFPIRFCDVVHSIGGISGTEEGRRSWWSSRSLEKFQCWVYGRTGVRKVCGQVSNFLI